MYDNSYNPYTPNSFYNPYQQRLNDIAQPASPHYEIIHVNGKGGVDALRMGANSQVLVLDDTAPIVWLITTDGAAYKTATPYDIARHVDAPQPDFTSLEQRVAKIEEALANGKPQSDARPTEPTARSSKRSD